MDRDNASHLPCCWKCKPSYNSHIEQICKPPRPTPLYLTSRIASATSNSDTQRMENDDTFLVTRRASKLVRLLVEGLTKMFIVLSSAVNIG